LKLLTISTRHQFISNVNCNDAIQ